ncbi:MAG: single-stranded DNA-binding protein [Roseiarcus sp.]
MTATALVTGKLAKAPERKTSKGGKPYGVANVRVGAGDAVTWWRVMVFDAEEIARLMELSAGETVSASGSFNAETYQSKKDGSTQIAFTLLADAVLTPRKRKRVRDDNRRADAA